MNIEMQAQLIEFPIKRKKYIQKKRNSSWLLIIECFHQSSCKVWNIFKNSLFA